MSLDKLKLLLILHEGLRLKTYLCTSGKLTVGVGHNLYAKPIKGIVEGSTISKQKAFEILDDDIDEVIDQLNKSLPWVKNLDEIRRAVLIDMAFNIGVAGLLRFRKFLKDLQEGSFSGDSVEMFRSRWAYQVGDGRGKKRDRVDRLADMIETGDWPFEIKRKVKP